MKTWERPLSWHAKRSLPVSVRFMLEQRQTVAQAFVSRKRDRDCRISWDAFLQLSPRLKSVAFGSTQEVLIEGHCDFLLLDSFFRFFRVMVYGCVKVSSYFPGVRFFL